MYATYLSIAMLTMTIKQQCHRPDGVAHVAQSGRLPADDPVSAWYDEEWPPGVMLHGPPAGRIRKHDSE
jgi:hypothetical protein